MRIGIFDPYLDTLGGGERYMFTVASCLSDKHEIDIFWHEADILAKARERFALNLSNVNVKENIFSHNVSLLRRLLATKQYDCIIYLSDGSFPLTLTKKLIIHFQFPVEWVEVDAFTKFKLARVRHIVCNSYFTKRLIDKKFHTTSKVLYPPVDIATKNYELGTQNKKNIILTVGRFGKLPEGKNFKKQDIMIEVFKEMVDRGFRDWEFIVSISFRWEDESEIGKLEALAKGYPIQIVKNLTSKELILFYKKAKVYWHAAGFGEDLVKNPHLAEHFGITTVEAMGNGSVPVVFQAGGQEEIIDDGRNGFFWLTKEELKKKTMDLISNEKLRLMLASNAQKKASKFSHKRFCDELKRLVL